MPGNREGNNAVTIITSSINSNYKHNIAAILPEIPKKHQISNSFLSYHQSVYPLQFL